MGFFKKHKKEDNIKEVWRNVNGMIVCPGDDCPKECDDSCPIYLNTQSLMLMQIGQNEKALEIYKKIIGIAPDFCDAYNNMASIYGKQGRFQEAYDCYMEAHNLNKTRPNSVYGLALCCRDLNRPDECIKWCDEYKKLSTDNSLEELCASMKQMLDIQCDVVQEINGEEEYQIVKDGEEWSIIKKDDAYFFLDRNKDYASTPRGSVLKTVYLELAERILNDLDEYGEDNFSVDVILPWHYTMIENFSRMSHAQVEQVLIDSFVNRHDWTYTIDASSTKWKEIWGKRGVREKEIMDWLSKITIMQMTAACCIGNAYHSINVAYMLARIMETSEGTDRISMFNELADFISLNSDWFASIDDFRTFELYYGIHLKEDGNVIKRN